MADVFDYGCRVAHHNVRQQKGRKSTRRFSISPSVVFFANNLLVLLFRARLGREAGLSQFLDVCSTFSVRTSSGGGIQLATAKTSSCRLPFPIHPPEPVLEPLEIPRMGIQAVLTEVPRRWLFVHCRHKKSNL